MHVLTLAVPIERFPPALNQISMVFLTYCIQGMTIEKFYLDDSNSYSASRYIYCMISGLGHSLSTLHGSWLSLWSGPMLVHGVIYSVGR